MIRQRKGQSVAVCGMLYQHWTLRPQTASVSKVSNRQRLETRTSLEPYCDNEASLQDMNEEEISTQDL